MPDHPADDHDTATELAPGAVRRERELPVPAEDAWVLLRDGEGLSRWLADDVDVVIEPGELGSLRDGRDERLVLVEEVEPGRRVALRWWTDGDESGGALVDLTIEPSGDDRSTIVVTEVPLRVVAVPDTVPAAWVAANPGGPSAGPELLAVAGPGR